MATEAATPRGPTPNEPTTPREYGLGKTERKDAWWVGPVLTALGLGAFGVYSTFRVIYNAEYELGHGAHSGLHPEHAYLLSPFYSPLLLDGIPVIGDLLTKFPWISPAMLILWMPGGFRLTCYYYRKAYYRAFFLDPPACGVGEPRNQYSGETKLFLFQNLHRYFLYLALAFLVILAIDTWHACWWPVEGAAGEDVKTEFGISIGTLVLALNTTMLSLYTFSCHSLRHLIGGNIDCYSCVALGNARHKAWKGVSFLNRKHMLWAWISLFVVGFTDFYVWMVARGLTDLRIL